MPDFTAGFYSPDFTTHSSVVGWLTLALRQNRRPQVIFCQEEYIYKERKRRQLVPIFSKRGNCTSTFV